MPELRLASDVGVRVVTRWITPYAQVINVAKSGGDYTTIQGAINAIIDATANKRYCVRVHSGVYTETITCKDYVDIIGDGRTNTIISGTSGTVLTFPANKCTVSEVGIDVDYGTLGANSTAIASAGADSILKDCDITVTKSAGDFLMYAMEITGGNFRMSDCYFTYSDTGATVATRLIQSAVVMSGALTTVILNNNEMTISTTDTYDDLVGFETTATVAGTCLLANNVITVDAGAAASSATGLWLYGTATGAIFNQNRLTVNCNASAYGLWIDSTAGGAVVDTRHNEIIITAVGAAEAGNVAAGDTWNSVYDKITAKTPFAGAGTITYASSPADGDISATGLVTAGFLTGAGQTVDLNGEIDALILDLDGDTTISAPVDDQIDFEVAGADQLHLTDGKLWPTTDNDIDLGDATHRFKDVHVIGHVGIGPNGAVDADRLVNVSDQAVNTTNTYYGFISRVDKTAGVTDFADSFYGARFQANLNQVGGEIGPLFGCSFLAVLNNGTVGNAVGGARNLYGIYGIADLNAGTVTDTSYGARILVDQEAANTTVDAVGLSIWMDLDGTISGTSYMVHLQELTGVDYGIYQNGTANNYFGGDVGIGDTTPNARLHVDQASTTVAIPVLALDQADLSEGFIDYLGTSAASAVGPISTWTAGNSIQGFIRVEINGAAYWMPYYDAPTS